MQAFFYPQFITDDEVKNNIEQYFQYLDEEADIPVAEEIADVDIISAQFGGTLKADTPNGHTGYLDSYALNMLSFTEQISTNGGIELAVSISPQMFDGAKLFGSDNNNVYILFNLNSVSSSVKWE